MPTDVVMPQMGESITEGTLTKWLKQPGDRVERDQPLFEISTDKVDAEIPAPVAGTLLEIKVQAGATVSVNSVVAVIGEAGEKPAAAAAPKPAAAPAPTPAPAAASPAPAPAAPAASTGGTEIVMPQMGESIFEGTITKWLKQVGDKVERDQPLFEISTDKVDAEITASTSGVLTEIRVAAGSTVAVNSVVAVIGGAAGASAPAPVKPAAAAPVPAPAAAPEVQSAPVAATGKIKSSPLVRKIARENNLDLARIPGSGAGGRITKSDALAALGQAPAPAAATPAASPTPAAAAPKPAAPAAPAPEPGSLVPLSKMRSIIAQRMVESKRTSPHVHTVFKVDMTRIVRIREREKSGFEKRNGVKLTYMPFITRATVSTLRKFPIINSVMEGEAIRYNRHINIGIAVALEWGLIVPVIPNTEERNFLGLARAIVDVADRARNKKLLPDELSGGTFTLTNSGIFGEQFGLPIINQPQSAILGIGGLSKEPVVLSDKEGNDTIAIRTMQHFSLGFDHRVIDGSDAGKFMAEFKSTLENWSEPLE